MWQKNYFCFRHLSLGEILNINSYADNFESICNSKSKIKHEDIGIDTFEAWAALCGREDPASDLHSPGGSGLKVQRILGNLPSTGTLTKTLAEKQSKTLLF